MYLPLSKVQYWDPAMLKLSYLLGTFLYFHFFVYKATELCNASVISCKLSQTFSYMLNGLVEQFYTLLVIKYQLERLENILTAKTMRVAVQH